MTNERLIKQIRDGSGQSRKFYKQLWRQNEKFVRQQANRWTTYHELADLMQHGYIIMHEAVEDFNPEAGVKFLSFLGQRLTWGWSRYLEESGQVIRLPAYMVQQVREYQKVKQMFIRENGSEPSENVLSSLLGVDPKTLHMIQKTAQKQRLRSLNELIEGEDGSTAELGDQIPDSTDLEAECIERVQNEQLAAVLWPMVDELPEEQGAVIRARYRDSTPFADLAEKNGEEMREVQSDYERGMRTLKKPHNQRKLQPFIEMRPFKATGLTAFNQTWTSATEREAIRQWFHDATGM